MIRQIFTVFITTVEIIKAASVHICSSCFRKIHLILKCQYPTPRHPPTFFLSSSVELAWVNGGTKRRLFTRAIVGSNVILFILNWQNSPPPGMGSVLAVLVNLAVSNFSHYRQQTIVVHPFQTSTLLLEPSISPLNNPGWNFRESIQLQREKAIYSLSGNSLKNRIVVHEMGQLPGSTFKIVKKKTYTKLSLLHGKKQIACRK